MRFNAARVLLNCRFWRQTAPMMIATTRPDDSTTPHALMLLHAAALFTRDARGRIVGSNEPEPERAPHLYLAVSDGIAFVRYRDDLPDALVERAERILDIANQSLARDTHALESGLGALAAAHAPGSQIHRGLAWTFPARIENLDGATAITVRNLDLLQPHFPYAAAHLDAQSPCFAIEQDGTAVAICFSSRNTPDSAEAGVFTLESARGRGYAPRVVAAWARAVRTEGRVPLYSADAENQASRAVARTLGLRAIGQDWSWG